MSKLSHADACITDAVYGTCQHASDPRADSQPTVRPWRVDPNAACDIIEDDPSQPTYMAIRIGQVFGDTREERAKRAELIITAVNSHDALVAALKSVSTWLIAPALDKETIAEMRATARGAIALAGGSTCT